MIKLLRAFFENCFLKYGNKEFLPLYGTVILYVAAIRLIAVERGWSDHLNALPYLNAVLLVTGFVIFLMVIYHTLRIMICERPKHLSRTLVAYFKENYLTKERLFTGLTLLIFYKIFIAAFSGFKAMIPLIHPFGWDSEFYLLDQKMHFGHSPWELSHMLVGSAWGSYAINFVYNLWFPIKFLVMYFLAFSLVRPTLRTQFFYTFFLAWMVNGSLLALLFSSAGPCYFDVAGGLPHGAYEPLMERLATQSDWLFAETGKLKLYALQTQTMLWDLYQTNGTALGSGISAFPSMHVSVAALILFYGLERGGMVKWASILFFVFIAIGSVHLGWHYAIDGYVGFFLTWVIWRLVKIAIPQQQEPETVSDDSKSA
ncbi:MAG: phosphatase PAP2 family protein [Pseudobdellovibrionaceae bacterium]